MGIITILFASHILLWFLFSTAEPLNEIEFEDRFYARIVHVVGVHWINNAIV